MKLQADLNFKDFQFQPKNSINFFRLNGKANLDQQKLSIPGLNVNSNGGQITLKGKADKFTSYVLGLGNVLYADLSLSSKQFDLSPYFGKREGLKPQKAKPSKRNNKPKNAGVLNDDLDITLRYTADNLKIKGLQTSRALIVAEYKKKVMNLKEVRMDLCGGSLNATGKLYNMRSLHSEIKVSGVNVTSLFSQMENFGQEAIKAEQLAGTLDFFAHLGAELDGDKKLLPQSLLGEVNLHLADGKLMNFEPLKNISNYVFRNRDFSDISFTAINEKFHLKGQAMKIDEMELASNVINLFVDGVFRFDKGNSLVNILVPWSSFKHRSKDYEAKASGESASETKGVKLHFSGPPKKMKMGVGHKKVDF